VVSNVAPLLGPQFGINYLLRNGLHSIINDAYYESYAIDLRSSVVTDLYWLGSSLELRSGDVAGNLPFRMVEQAARTLGILPLVSHAKFSELLQLRDDPRWQKIRNDAIFFQGATRANLVFAQRGSDESPPSTNLPDLLQAVLNVRPGKKAATAFQGAICALLIDLFEPILKFDRMETPLNDARKRVDITFENTAGYGFFRFLSLHKPSMLIFVECKNYSQDVGNPELDQLAGRFSPERGQFGLLMCRRFDNKKLFQERCRDTAREQKGFIVAIDDADLRSLVDCRQTDRNYYEWPLLRERFKKLIM
jgi:hypothetical protein